MVENNENSLNMQQVRRTNDSFEHKLDGFGLDALPEDVRNGTQAIGTKDLKSLYTKLCGTSAENDYDSDDSLKSDIDDMDSHQLASKSEEFRKNLEKVDRMNDNSKLIDNILAINVKKKRNAPKEDPLETGTIVKIEESGQKLDENLTRQNDAENAIRNGKPSVSDVAKRIRAVEIDNGDADSPVAAPPAKKRNKPDGKIDSWLVRKDGAENALRVQRNQDIQVFEKSKEEDARYLKLSEFLKILQVLVDLVEKYQNDENQTRPIDHVEVISCVKNDEFEKALEKEMEMTSFYCPLASRSKYILKKVKQIFKQDIVDEILCEKKYGFRMKTKDCLKSIRRCYFSNRSQNKDTGKSIDILKLSSYELIKACDSVKRELKPDKYTTNELVGKYLLTKK